MKLKLISVGKIKDAGLRDSVEDYLKRLKRHYDAEWVELRKESADRPVAEIKKIEGERILAAAGQAYLVLLDEHGKTVNSRQFADKLGGWADSGVREVAFAIGGAYGHSEEAKAKAAWQWSLSPLTFTHQHVPLLVAEQLYRAGTILRGEPYHND